MKKYTGWIIVDCRLEILEENRIKKTILTVDLTKQTNLSKKLLVEMIYKYI